jgi:hypothetical protein
MRPGWKRLGIGLAIAVMLMVGAASPLMAQERLEQDFDSA